MKAGYLSDYFDGVGFKRLTRVEIDRSSSNQHEFQGINEFKLILGIPKGKDKYQATFLRLSDDSDPESGIFEVTWYDGRKNQEHRSPEYRIYYPSEATPIVESSKPNDLLIISKLKDNHLLIIIADAGSTYEQQLIWLFGIGDTSRKFNVSDQSMFSTKELDLSARLILDELGIEVEAADENWLDQILSKFGNNFPSTKIFSLFARETLPDVTSLENPDKALISWIEQEEMLFRTLERHIVSKQLEKGFDDVDNFISYSLSVQNRRKSRVGHALEHHVEFIFAEHKVKYSRGAETENKAKPDFIFPGIDFYHDDQFKPICLSMLGVKSTCKDRWRQVLSEAEKINQKHLFTLEPGISENQTNEMKANSLSLVLPEELHQSYTDPQKKELLNLDDFIGLLKDKESNCIQ